MILAAYRKPGFKIYKRGYKSTKKLIYALFVHFNGAPHPFFNKWQFF